MALNVCKAILKTIVKGTNSRKEFYIYIPEPVKWAHQKTFKLCIFTVLRVDSRYYRQIEWNILWINQNRTVGNVQLMLRKAEMKLKM